MNASITQQRRFGLLGARNTLYLGLPLLNAMRVSEIKAIVAHEMGHFVAQHGRSTAFAYTLRTRWHQIGERLPDGIVAGVLRRFFEWYGPWFASYSFVLARRQELEADAIAAKAAGARAAGHALIRVALQARLLDEGWRCIWSQSVLRPDPPVSPHRTLAAAVLEVKDGLDDLLVDALQVRPDLDDTHPSLTARLAALDVSPAPPPQLIEPAAPILLGEALGPVTDKLDAQWHDAADETWAEVYTQRQEYHREREDLDARGLEGELDVDEQFRHAGLIELLDGPKAGAAAFAALVAAHPDAHGARFRNGDALLDAGDEDGVALLLEAAEAEPELRVHACRRLAQHFHATNRPERAQPYWDEAEEAEQRQLAARKEAETIDERVTLRPLDAATRTRLADLLIGMEGLRRMDAAVRDLSTGPQIVFVFGARRGCVAGELLDRVIETLLPEHDLLGIEHSQRRSWLRKRLRALPNSRVVG
nr:M48 family metalloprotease [Sphingomonas aerophila]